MDETNFQINLLTLNAAVQTACAAEAATGFAIVADQMRNLSQRSAQAAKHTALPVASTARYSAVTPEQLASHSKGLLALVTRVQSLFGETIAPELGWTPPALSENGAPVRALTSIRGRAAFPLDESQAGTR